MPLFIQRPASYVETQFEDIWTVSAIEAISPDNRHNREHRPQNVGSELEYYSAYCRQPAVDIERLYTR